MTHVPTKQISICENHSSITSMKDVTCIVNFDSDSNIYEIHTSECWKVLGLNPFPKSDQMLKQNLDVKGLLGLTKNFSVHSHSLYFSINASEKFYKSNLEICMNQNSLLNIVTHYIFIWLISRGFQIWEVIFF